jgi:uncharacterized membrane protein YvbJ
MIVCQACGTSNSPNATHCSKCARKLDPATQNAVAQQRAQHSATGVNWSSVVIALIVIILVAAVLVLVVVTHAL